MSPASAEQIDALLPQTQCRRCGFDGCRPYAEAIAAGETDINRCPPGGEQTILRLAELTGYTPKPLAPECGRSDQREVAFIREDECIGCTKCIQVCPVDAIVGAAKLMHTVIADECTGCELCVPACPVDCIDLLAAPENQGQPHWPPESDTDTRRANRARRRYQQRNNRLRRDQREKAAQRDRKKAAVANNRGDADQTSASRARKQEIAAAIARAKARRTRRD